jgi:hypothetical protein
MEYRWFFCRLPVVYQDSFLKTRCTSECLIVLGSLMESEEIFDGNGKRQRRKEKRRISHGETSQTFKIPNLKRRISVENS